MSDANEAMLAAQAKLAARMGNKTAVGGKGVARRKNVKKHVPVAADSSKLTAQMKKMGCNPIPHIEEANMFLDDGKVIHFENPKLQASLAANTYVITGNSEKKNLQDLLPGIINQLGNENLSSLQKLSASEGAGKKNGKEDAEDDDDDDAEIPDVAGDFEEVSKVD